MRAGKCGAAYALSGNTAATKERQIPIPSCVLRALCVFVFSFPFRSGLISRRFTRPDTPPQSGH